MTMISGYDNDLYKKMLTKKKGWAKSTINAYTKGTNGETCTRTEVLWKNAKLVRALELDRVPIRISAREKLIRKINPPRK